MLIPNFKYIDASAKMDMVTGTFKHLIENRNEIDEALSIGAAKAKKIAQTVLQRVRKKAGYAKT